MQIDFTQNKNINLYFVFLFSFIPISILFGPTVSLINIIVIDTSFLILILKLKNFYFLKNKNFRYLIILFLYLIFNTLISLDYTLSMTRNLGFVRVMILFLAFNYFFSNHKFLNKVLISWAVILSIVCFDIFVEFLLGRNLLGFNGGIYENRIVSFFKDEPIVGSFVNGFFLIVIGFLLNKYNLSNKNIIFLFAIIMLLTVILTGERSSSIRLILSLALFILFISSINLKKKIVFLLSSVIILTIVILNSDFLKYRFINQIKNVPISQNLYLKIYTSGVEVFKNYPLFGVGNKNYREETCNIDEKKNNLYLCQTHPHQVYLEFLSEHGIFGTLLIFYVLYKMIFSKIRMIIVNQNFIQIGGLMYLLMIFLPLIPSGAFFGDFLLTLFAINLSMLYSSDTNLNTFTGR